MGRWRVVSGLQLHMSIRKFSKWLMWAQPVQVLADQHCLRAINKLLCLLYLAFRMALQAAAAAPA
jgi:hypothetical protein